MPRMICITAGSTGRARPQVERRTCSLIHTFPLAFFFCFLSPVLGYSTQKFFTHSEYDTALALLCVAVVVNVVGIGLLLSLALMRNLRVGVRVGAAFTGAATVANVIGMCSWNGFVGENTILGRLLKSNFFYQALHSLFLLATFSLTHPDEYGKAGYSMTLLIISLVCQALATILATVAGAPSNSYVQIGAGVAVEMQAAPAPLVLQTQTQESRRHFQPPRVQTAQQPRTYAQQQPQGFPPQQQAYPPYPQQAQGYSPFGQGYKTEFPLDRLAFHRSHTASRHNRPRPSLLRLRLPQCSHHHRVILRSIIPCSNMVPEAPSKVVPSRSKVK